MVIMFREILHIDFDPDAYPILQLLGELFAALRGRLCDSNKNLVMATLSTIGGFASAMGPAVEKSSKVPLEQKLLLILSFFKLF